MSSERLAAAARRRHEELLELVALRAEELIETLREELDLVVWDCQVVIGRAQRDLRRLVEGASLGPVEQGASPAVRVIERRRQPLECLPLVWGALLRGRRVWLGVEEGASSAAVSVLREIHARLVGDGITGLTFVRAQRVLAEELDEELAGAPLLGALEAAPRLAVIGVDGDRELAAYVLARTCLRRCGEEPRTIHHALVCGPNLRLERYLQRLWVGVVIGPAADPESFSGPATAELAEAYLAALELWRSAANVRALCPGGALERAGQARTYLAPALFRVPWPLPAGVPMPGSPELPIVGPMLVLYTLKPEQLGEASAALGFPAARQLWIAPPPLGGVQSGGPRYVQGALVIDRMPPGLPEPRPV